MDIPTNQGRQVRDLRKLALILSFTSSQVLVLFPFLLCVKIYFYPELHWSWVLAFPQMTGGLWLLLTPYNRLRFLGFLLLSTPTLVVLGLQSAQTYWICHAALLPFYLGLLGRKKFPLGLVVSSQLHLEGFLTIFNNAELVQFPRWPTASGVTVLVIFCIGTILLPLAVLSVAYLIHQTTKSVIAVTCGWVALCVLLSLNAVHAVELPVFIFAILLAWIGVWITLDGVAVFVSWRTRLTMAVWPFLNDPAPASQRSLRPRGLTAREISELPILVINRLQTEVPYDALCTICQDNVEEGRTALLLPACRHVFHPECVIQWLKRKPVCPNCNLDVREGITSTIAATNESQAESTSGASTRPSTARAFSSLLGSLVTGHSRNHTPRSQNPRSTVAPTSHRAAFRTLARESGGPARADDSLHRRITTEGSAIDGPLTGRPTRLANSSPPSTTDTSTPPPAQRSFNQPYRAVIGRYTTTDTSRPLTFHAQGSCAPLPPVHCSADAFTIPVRPEATEIASNSRNGSTNSFATR